MSANWDPSARPDRLPPDSVPPESTRLDAARPRLAPPESMSPNQRTPAIAVPVDDSHLEPCPRCGVLNGRTAASCWNCEFVLSARTVLRADAAPVSHTERVGGVTERRTTVREHEPAVARSDLPADLSAAANPLDDVATPHPVPASGVTAVPATATVSVLTPPPTPTSTSTLNRNSDPDSTSAPASTPRQCSS